MSMLDELLDAAKAAEMNIGEDSDEVSSEQSANGIKSDEETMYLTLNMIRTDDSTIGLDGMRAFNARVIFGVTNRLCRLWKNPDLTSELWLKKIVHNEALRVALRSCEDDNVRMAYMLYQCAKPEKWELDSYDFDGPMTGRCTFAAGRMKGYTFSVEEDGVYLRNENGGVMRFGDKPKYYRYERS